MNVLAFDTAFDSCSVAAGRGLRSLSPEIVAFHEPMAAGQAERLVPMIAEALSATGMEARHLDRIAVTLGPGTFTGTRITIAAARALSLVTNAPIVAISSLKLMAMNAAANARGADCLAIATDARRGEVYFECFEPRTLVSFVPPRALSVADAARALAGCRSVVAGSGAEAVADAGRAHGHEITAVAPFLLPDAVDMLFPAMEMAHFNTVQALYLRPPDAKPQNSTAVARTPA